MIRYNAVIVFILITFINCSNKRDLLPEDFFGLKLEQKLTGTEARNFVDKLHFQEVASDKNEIGFYKSSAGSAIIYITYYSDDEMAKEEYESMINKISPYNSVFVDPEFIKVKDKTIYRCFGMGQTHYVFANGKELFWVSVDTPISNKFIEEYFGFIN